MFLPLRSHTAAFSSTRIFLDFASILSAILSLRIRCTASSSACGGRPDRAPSPHQNEVFRPGQARLRLVQPGCGVGPAQKLLLGVGLASVHRLNLAKRTETLARRAQAKPNGVFEKYQILVLKIMACRNLEIVLCTSEPIFLELPSARVGSEPIFRIPLVSIEFSYQKLARPNPENRLDRSAVAPAFDNPIAARVLPAVLVLLPIAGLVHGPRPGFVCRPHPGRYRAGGYAASVRQHERPRAVDKFGRARHRT